MDEAAKDIVLQAIEVVWNGGDLDAVERFFSPDYVSHDPVAEAFGRRSDRDELKDDMRRIRGAVPDIQYTIEDVVAEGNKVVTRWSARGTHTGNVEGVAATNQAVTITGMTSCQVNAQGMITESFTHSDVLLAMRGAGFTM
jgi:steroid delta-isomerase-like uncharacterized protein